ncbi:MAG TPA: SDR family oxidoreductase [Candidatus Dormibacteraeota bacterium]|nr:SDR family oxidoreductase [Candidatus Dormibacteraeota bacterium]
MDLGLRGRTAFVAAASRGMGRAIALQFAAEGSDVGLCARDADALEDASASIRETGARAIPSVADVTDEAAVEAAVQRTVAGTGRLDALIVNAGGPPTGTFDSVADDEWNQTFQLLLMSSVHLVRTALPALRRSDAASILFVTSSAVRQPIAGLLLSNSLRAAVTGLAKTLAGELAPIRVNTIMPGRIRTGRQESLMRQRHPHEDLEQAIAEEAKTVPLGRFGDPAEFARAAVFLSSPGASYITGVTLAVDGGLIQSSL